MANRITDTQIELARDCWRRGKSIPKCCRISNMSRASFMKYLGSELDSWLDERLQQQRINEIQPEPTVAVTTGETTIDSDDDFIRLIEAEFDMCTDHIEAKDLYHHYRPQASTNLKRTEALRKLYESALSRKPNITADIRQSSADQHRKTIKAFKSRHHIKIPIPRASTMADWSEHRLYEHMYYWYVVDQHSHKAAVEAIADKTLADYKEWWDKTTL